MIEDLDGGDVGPARAPIVRAISVLLVIATAIGWAALQSPALRGPYATPDPGGGVTFTARFTPAPALSIEPAAVGGRVSTGCVVPGSINTAYVFVGGHLVTVTVSQPSSLGWRTCLPTVPLERVAP